jgi:hypothetical protein
MNIKQNLESLYRYYFSTRGVGHTYTMLNGVVSNPKVKVVTANIAHAKTLGLKREQVITLDNLERLRGTNCPLVFDNYTLMCLLNDAIGEINRLEKNKEEYKNGWLNSFSA